MKDFSVYMVGLRYFVAGVLFLVFSAQASAAFKCWTNSDGIKECGNSLPPEYVKQRVEILSEKSGTVKEVKAAAKTAEQLAEEERLKKIQRQREKEIARQKAYDDVLLKTYLSIDDLLLSLHWKITTLDSRISITEGSIEAEKSKFLKYTRQAAQLERQGKTIPETIKTNLENINKAIANMKNKIVLLEQDKKDIYKKFDYDSKRFMVATINGLSLTLKDDEKARQLNMIQLRCQGKAECDTMWQKAKAFVDKQSKLDIIFDNDLIKTTISPRQEDDLAFVVSRVNNKYYEPEKERITLQIRCYPSTEGDKLCKSDKVTRLLNWFKQTLQAG